VITGDLAHRGEVGAYALLREHLARLAMPVWLIVGNHDLRANLRAVFADAPRDGDGFVQCVVNTPVGLFILLDTLEEGQNWGSFCARRRAWLQAALRSAQQSPVFLFMHHPPFDCGIPCLDRIGLRDGAAFAETLRGHPVRHLFFGHYHRPVTGSWRGIPFSTMRGTNHQVPLDFLTVDYVPKSHEPPAYAVVFIEAEQVTVHFHDYLDRSVIPYDQLDRSHALGIEQGKPL
jgi:3',5'-cyclic AMP phosphodiesterase CpdA